MISQFFILSQRGDKLVSRDFRNDITKGAEELFFRRVKFWDGDAPPVFNIEGINFVHVVRNSLYVVCTTRQNISPNLLVEFLSGVCCRLFKDFVGTLTEDALRSNMVMVYEILDELLDYGYIQNTTTEGLKVFVVNESVDEDSSKRPNTVSSAINNRIATIGSALITRRTLDSSATNASIQDSSKKHNDLFIDIYERLNAVFDSQGTLIRSEVIGSINMKSFLAGQPRLRMALNENLLIGRNEKRNLYGGGPLVRIDNCSFNDIVQLNDFQHSRVLSFVPPVGSFTVMTYRQTNVNSMPFRIFSYVSVGANSGSSGGFGSSSLISNYKVELIVKIRADFDKKAYGSKVLVTIPIPKDTSNASVEFGVGSQTTYEYKVQEKQVVWGITKFVGGTEQIIRIKITLKDKPTYDIKKQIGPITMKFEMPMHNVTGLQVRYLKFDDSDAKNAPNRWMRYICSSNSFQLRSC